MDTGELVLCQIYELTAEGKPATREAIKDGLQHVSNNDAIDGATENLLLYGTIRRRITPPEGVITYEILGHAQELKAQYFYEKWWHTINPEKIPRIMALRQLNEAKAELMKDG